MALRVLLLNQQRKRLQKSLDELRAKTPDFDRRCADLEKAVGEAESEADQTAVGELVDEYEQERAAHDGEITRLEGDIATLTRQIQEEEANQAVPPPAAPAVDPNHPTTAPPEERKDDNTMPNTRGRILGLTRSQFGELVKRDESKPFLSRVREMIREKRTISGAELLIPDHFMGLIRENVPVFSKLYKYTFARHLKGTSRQTVMGTVPEGVWTEMCANLNELDLGFSGVELDGYMVGGFVAVCNAILEDSDINLAQEVLTAIIKGIALALDKAIVYGTGTRMPMGIVTRLTQSAAPEVSKNSVPWKDLRNSNVLALGNLSGTELFKALLTSSGSINTDYGDGETFWVMNRRTKMKLMAEALGVNANGAIVAGMNNTMPVEGGSIETLSFMPDDVLVGGGAGLYSVLERAGISLKTFDQTRAVQNQTLFIGTARYDGIPVIADGFVAISLGEAKPVANAVTFTLDKANQAA
ncbi:MAG: phage major capsid protein [Oscillospiraceae bacterium]|nr:phage major capsid protein [Oscillospiraceae bacterium]